MNTKNFAGRLTHYPPALACVGSTCHRVPATNMVLGTLCLIVSAVLKLPEGKDQGRPASREQGSAQTRPQHHKSRLHLETVRGRDIAPNMGPTIYNS